MQKDSGVEGILVTPQVMKCVEVGKDWQTWTVHGWDFEGVDHREQDMVEMKEGRGSILQWGLVNDVDLNNAEKQLKPKLICLFSNCHI